MKIASVVVNRNDGYKDFERGLIHFKSMVRSFDEVNYVDWIDNEKEELDKKFNEPYWEHKEIEYKEPHTPTI